MEAWSCIILEKTRDPILRKLSDGCTDGETDGETDDSFFIGSCPTNIERQTTRKITWNCLAIKETEPAQNIKKDNGDKNKEPRKKVMNPTISPSLFRL